MKHYDINDCHTHVKWFMCILSWNMTFSFILYQTNAACYNVVDILPLKNSGH